MTGSKENIMEQYIRRYPQLGLKVEEGMSESAEYKDIVRKGKTPLEINNYFLGDEEDAIFLIDTPCGQAEVIYLANRDDFERAVRCLAYKCENKKIPKSMGALTISGISNWGKIKEHKKEYLMAGNTDWQAEFKRFIKMPENYKDRLVLLSKGGYSAITSEDAGFNIKQWEDYSLKIRMYHELCHVICRNIFPEKRHAVIDEIVADCFGILNAIGKYDTDLAKKFLGIENGSYRRVGRLENYIDIELITADYLNNVREVIQLIEVYLYEVESEEYWGKLISLEKNIFDSLVNVLDAH